jgi:hypothetical protein
MSAARPMPEPADPKTMDHFVYLRVDWQGYQQLLALRGESSVPRITYLEGLAELMSPLRYHEIDKTRFARLLEAYDVCREIPASELLPQLPVDVLLACMQEPDQTSAVRALRPRRAAP